MAFADCRTDSVRDCFDTTRSAAKQVVTDPYNAGSHLNEAWKATKDCFQCASEELGNKLNSFSSDQNSQQTYDNNR